jgi:acetyl-CoA C-acetyltransferase
MRDKRDAVIVSAARTAIGKFMGTLSTTPAPRLGAVAIKEAVRRAGVDPATIDEVLMGCVVPAGIGQAPARQASIFAGLPSSVCATTFNKVCGSGLKTVMLAAQAVKSGDADVVVAGGMENMSLAPYLLPQGRAGYRLGDGKVVDSVVKDGLWCPFEDQHMGVSAEFIAEKHDITRAQLDEFAYNSQIKAAAAIKAGKFKAEIAPVEMPQRKGPPILFDTDECPRGDTTVEALAKLRPAFKEGGIVTAGNAPGITDGGAAVVVMSRERADKLGIKPLATITGYAQAGVDPLWIFIAPVNAVRKLMEKTGKTINDYDLIEANEAFAAQAMADGKVLGWDWNRVNVNGGAIALGHPIGCSGTRILVTLLHALKDRGQKTGMATLCLGGGEAVALSVEME